MPPVSKFATAPRAVALWTLLPLFTKVMLVPIGTLSVAGLKPESVIVDGDVLIVDQSNRRHLRVKLQERPEISAFVDSIRGTLAGDQSALEKVYSIRLSGTAENWRLWLVPLQEQMVRIVSRIQMAGSQGDLTTIEFDFADGDRSEMVVTKARSR